MKYVETSYSNRSEILKFPDHYVAVAVTVDDSGILANDEGKKIVLAGTIVGGGTLADENVKVKKHVADSLTTELAGDNNDLVFTAKKNKTIKVQYLDPAGNSKELSVSISGDAIVVSLATNESGTIISTAAQIKAAIDAHLLANELVSVDNAADNDGLGVVIAMAATALSGGVSAEGVLLNEVDVTYGSAGGAMVLHAFLDKAKVEAAQIISEQAKDALKQIEFIK